MRPAEQDALIEEFGGRCTYGCGRRADTWDHVVPVAMGGQTEPGNVVPACRSCNSKKRDRDPGTWLQEHPGTHDAVFDRLALLWELPSETPVEALFNGI